MAKPVVCVCKAPNRVHRVAEIQTVHETEGDRVEIHVADPIPYCADCGGEVLSREVRALLRVERQQRQIIERLERLEAAAPSVNGSHANGSTPETPVSNGAERLLRSGEVAAILRTSPRSVNNLRRAGKLRAVPINERHFGYRREDVEEYERGERK